MEKSKIKIIKGSLIAAAVVAALVLVYNLCVFFFVFKANFGRNDSPRTVEHEIEFFAGEENYNRHLADVEWLNSQKTSIIEITSRDGLKLKAIELDSETAPKGTVLLFHGYCSAPEREWSTLSKFLHELGYNVVMPYQRSHGLSEGKWITFGINERFDCVDWMKKVNEIYGEDKPLFVGGISMGCSTILMACGSDEVPANVRGYLADCGFTSPYEVTYWTMTTKKHIPTGVSKTLLWSMNWFGTHFANFPLSGYSTATALNHCDKPILFVTGTKDEIVPYEMTMSNFLQYKVRNPDNARLLLVEDGKHAVSYMLQPEKYRKELKNFLEKYGD